MFIYGNVVDNMGQWDIYLCICIVIDDICKIPVISQLFRYDEFGRKLLKADNLYINVSIYFVCESKNGFHI